MNLLTTGVGSVPFLDLSEAIRYSFLHTIPFLPQMPKLGEDMILPLISHEKLDKNCPCLRAFQERLEKENKTFFKIQLASPDTVETYSKNFSFNFYQKKVDELLSIFTKISDEFIFIFDAPLFSKNHKKTLLEVSRIKKKFSNILIGIHCCGFKENFSDLKELSNKFDILSLPASQSFSFPKLIYGISPKNQNQIKDLNTEKKKIIVSSECGLANYSRKMAWTFLSYLYK